MVDIDNKILFSNNAKDSNYIIGDCRLETYRWLLQFQDINSDIEDLLGFGEGLDFNVSEMKFGKKVPLLYVFGKKIKCEQNYSYKFNVPIKYNKSFNSSEELFEPKIMYLIERGIPVVVNVDRYFLDFLNIKKAHFGYHVIMIVDIDQKKYAASIIDVMSSKIEHMDIKTLKKAMYSDIEFLSPNGEWYYIDNIENYKRKDDITFKSSLYNQSISFLDKNGALEQMYQLIGVIDKLVKRSKLSQVYKDYLEYQIPFLISLFKEQEGSGTFYRCIYFNFLKNNCTIFHEINLYEEIHKLIIDDINLWENIGPELISNKDIIMQAKKLTEILKNIYEIERDIFLKINNKYKYMF